MRLPSFIRALREQSSVGFSVIVVLLIDACLVLFAAVARIGFLGDDYRYLYTIEHLKDFNDGVQYVIQPLGASFVWRPLINLFWMAEQWLFGTNPLPYHLVHLALYLGAAWLLYLIVRRIGGRMLGIVTASLFVIMPFHVETIAWLSSLTDLLALFCGLAAVVLYLRYRETRRPALLVFSATWYFSALCAKEFTLMIPFVLVMLDVLFPKEGARYAWRSYVAPYATIVGVTVVYLALRYAVLGNLTGSDPDTTGLFRDSFLPSRLKYALGSFTFIFNHEMLSVFSERIADLWLRWRTYASVGFVAALFFLNTARFRDRSFWRQVAFAVGLTVLFSIPVMPLLANINQNLEHTRFLYAPSMGIALLIAVLLVGSSAKGLYNALKRTMLVVVSVVFVLGISMNFVPWTRATKLITFVIDDIARNHAALANTDRPTILFEHAVPGGVDGAYAFHDLYSFHEAFDMRFRNDKVTVVPVGRYRSDRALSLCAPDPQTEYRLLHWKDDRFVREDDVVAPWANAPHTPSIGFDSYESFVRAGWQLRDATAGPTDTGSVAITPTGQNPSITVALSERVIPADLRNVTVEFGDDGNHVLQWSWVSRGGASNSFQSIPASIGRKGDIPLCQFTNWYVGGELGTVMLILPKTGPRQLIITHLSVE